MGDDATGTRSLFGKPGLATFMSAGRRAEGGPEGPERAGEGPQGQVPGPNQRFTFMAERGV